MPAITISTHNGSRVSLEHNVRDPAMVESENKKWENRHPGELRIDPDGEYEIWKNESLESAYEKLFGEALKEWNDRQDAQGKPERKIKNYLAEIRAKVTQSKNSKKPLYEIIYALGSHEHPVEEEAARAILKEMADGFEKRNPNLYPICKVLHNDEAGVMHVHVSYIPVAENCKRGMKTQNSLSNALKQQGIVSSTYADTAQMAWERKENDYMESLCNQYGYTVIHPQRGTQQEHLSVEAYKLKKEIDGLKKELGKLKELPSGKTLVNRGRLKQLEDIEAQYLRAKSAIEQSGRDSIAARDAIKAYTVAVENFKKDKSDFNRKVNAEANRKARLINADAVSYISQAGLSENFALWRMAYADLKRQQQQQELEYRKY